MSKEKIIIGVALNSVNKQTCSGCETKLSTVHIGTDGKAYCGECIKGKGITEMAVFDIGFRTVDSYGK